MYEFTQIHSLALGAEDGIVAKKQHPSLIDYKTFKIIRVCAASTLG
jgi:hypothetical protein